MGQPQEDILQKTAAKIETIQQLDEAIKLSEKLLAQTTEIGEIIEDEVARRQKLVEDAVADGRKLVTVRAIDAIDDIPGADLIKVATIEGWKVVVKAGEFKPGDKCVYFETDSYLPLSDARFSFLEKNAINWQDIRGVRLKAITLRKQRSEGLALPVRDFPEVQPFLSNEDLRDINFTGAIGIMKWEKVLSAQLAGQARGNFPSFLRKSDQERCQNMGSAIFGYEPSTSSEPIDVTGIPEDALIAMRGRGELDENNHRIYPAQASRDTEYEVTLKMDGSSMTVYSVLPEHEGDEIRKGVCSRNLDLKMEGNDDNAFVKIANEGLLDVLTEFCVQTGRSIALQGELMGPGIQGNREEFKETHFFLYNIYDVKAGYFVNPTERCEILRQINDIAEATQNKLIEHVPVLVQGKTLDELGIVDMAALLSYAVGPSLKHKVREGVVFKALDGSKQFKAISHVYLDEEG